MTSGGSMTVFGSSRRGSALLLLAVACLTFAPLLYAQVTTGNIAGNVTTRQDNSALPGVTVEAVPVPTGTRYSAVSGANGRYSMPNVKVGGPYSVSTSLDGF